MQRRAWGSSPQPVHQPLHQGETLLDSGLLHGSIIRPHFATANPARWRPAAEIRSFCISGLPWPVSQQQNRSTEFSLDSPNVLPWLIAHFAALRVSPRKRSPGP